MAKSKTIYVVTETSYEYNDETYNESDGGEPVEAFTDKAKAEASMAEKTSDWIRTTDIFDYGYELNSVVNSNKLATIIGIDKDEIEKLSENWDYDTVYKAMKGKEAEIASILRLKPFSITEIELSE